jgi:putative spermidine/putrescine transport system substrate-binding protein
MFVSREERNVINVLQQMLDRRNMLKGTAAAAGALALNRAWSLPATAQDEASLPADASDMDALIANAQAENKIVSYGMPDYWANLGEMWATFLERYGIAEHEDADLSSAQEIAKFLAEAENPIADIGDIGIQFAPTAVQLGVCAPFKNDTWDRIPDWAKHPDGLWAVQYYGNLVFLINTDLVETSPQSFADLLNPEYQDMVSISDPKNAAQGNYTVFAAAFANGGDEFDVQPGLDYFKQLKEAGNLKTTSPDLANFQKGETVIGILWDYLAFEFRDQLQDQVNLEIVVPQDASVAGPYASIINAFAPHPHAARLMRNFILSDEGQIIYAKGYATPILPDVTLPEEVLAIRPSAEEYASVRTINDWNQGFIAFQKIASEWGPYVLGQ